MKFQISSGRPFGRQYRSVRWLSKPCAHWAVHSVSCSACKLAHGQMAWVAWTLVAKPVPCTLLRDGLCMYASMRVYGELCTLCWGMVQSA